MSESAPASVGDIGCDGDFDGGFSVTSICPDFILQDVQNR